MGVKFGVLSVKYSWKGALTILLIVKYWFKILAAQESKYIKLIYNLMLQDIELEPNKINWTFINVTGFLLRLVKWRFW